MALLSLKITPAITPTGGSVSASSAVKSVAVSIPTAIGLVLTPSPLPVVTGGGSMAANVKTVYGAKGGAKIVTDAAIVATQNTVSSAQAAFTSADVGKFMYIEGAGANIPNTSPTLQATMIAKISSVAGGVATLTTTGGGAITATTTVSGATAYFGVDDSATFATALAAGPIYVPTDIYLWASGITITSTDVQMFGDGFGQTVILAPATNSAQASHLLVRGSIAAGTTLSADVAAGATSFTTTSNPNLGVGDYIVLADGTNTFNTWPGGTSNRACRGEMLRVQSVTGAGPFTVNTFGLIQDQYQVNNAARVQKASMLSGVRIENVEFRSTTPYSLLTGTSAMLWLEWCIDAYVKARVRGNPGYGFQAGACWDGDFYIDAEDLKDGDALNAGSGGALGWWGYGAFASMCDRDCRYFINAKRVRHAFTNSGGSSSANPSTLYGVPRSIHVDGVASDCTNASWDTHADGKDIHFGKIDAHGGLQAGLQIRAPHTTIGDLKVSFVQNGGVLIQPACTQGTITSNGSITLSTSVATTSGQASGVVVLSSVAGIPTAGGVVTIGGTAIKYTGVSGSTLTGCTCQAVASGTITTASTVLCTQDLSGSPNVLSHAINAHIKSAHIHDVFTGVSAGKGIDILAPNAKIDAAYIHDIDSNGLWLRGTGSSPLANCAGLDAHVRILNPGRGSGNGVFIETTPPDVTIGGYIDGANSGIINGATTSPLRLNTSGLMLGNNVTHGAADDFSAHGYGPPKIPAGRAGSRGGTATLVAGTVTVSATSVTGSTLLILSRRSLGGTPGHLSYTIVAATSFTITSSSGTDTSTIDWVMIEKGPT